MFILYNNIVSRLFFKLLSWKNFVGDSVKILEIKKKGEICSVLRFIMVKLRLKFI